MKIAIIGGGFYGAHIANNILKKNKNIKIDLFEKEPELFLGAFTNNQHRLHLGYHYPRSVKTIEQSLFNYDKFKIIYNEYIKIPDYNIYSIENSSSKNFYDYCKIYDNYNLEYKELNNDNLNLLFNKIKTNKITNSIIVKEGTVDFLRLSEFLKEELMKNKNIQIILNKKINNIDKIKLDYDFIINATYNDANLFLENKIPLKHEVCCILLAENVMPQHIGMTVVDGDFCSIFPKNKNIHSISSVSHTPFFKYKNNDLSLTKKEIFDLYNQSNAKINILDHANSYVDISSKQIIGEMLSIKTKFDDDIGDTREALWIKEVNYYSIFCGKISAICSISEEIINDIGL